MYIWYVSLYEPLPIGGDQTRPMRSGLLAEALVAAGHRLELWLPGFEHVHHTHFRKESALEPLRKNYYLQYISGCGYRHDTSIKRLVHNHQLAREFKILASRRSQLPDVIVTQIPALELAEAVSEFAQRHGIPLVVDIRDLWPDVYQRLFPKSLWFMYHLIFQGEIRRAQRILRRAQGVTAVSRTFLEWAVDKAKREAGVYDRVFPIGYPAIAFSAAQVDLAALEAKYRFTRKAVTVFFAGTFCSSYDLDTVFKAAQLLLDDKVCDLQIVLAGGGDREDDIRSRCEALSNLSYVGWLDAVDLSAFLSIATVGLAPYAGDALMSLPNKPFEYMAASLPVLSCLDGELKELIEAEQCGRHYPAGDAAALASALVSFLENPEQTQAMGDRGRIAVAQKYDSKIIYTQFAKYLEEMVHDFRRAQAKGN